MPTSKLLELPRELRDMIYKHYVIIDGGYVFNPTSGRLEPVASRDQHYFGLQQTCKLICWEMRGLALTHNTVSFSTVKESRKRASCRKPSYILNEIRWEANQLGAYDRGMFEQFCLSAGSVATQYLESNPGIHKHLRRIVLRENRSTEPSQPSQCRRLVPLCLENPHLQIERRVNLWTNVLSEVCRTSKTLARMIIDELTVPTHVLVRRLQDWITEHLALPPNFTLVLDGEPASAQCAEIFQRIVVREAVFQQALEKSYARQGLPYPDLSQETASIAGFYFKGFPETIRDLFRDSADSRIRCNFLDGEFPDQMVEDLVQQFHGLNQEDWTLAWERQGAKETFRNMLPLPARVAHVVDELGFDVNY